MCKSIQTLRIGEYNCVAFSKEMAHDYKGIRVQKRQEKQEKASLVLEVNTCKRAIKRHIIMT